MVFASSAGAAGGARGYFKREGATCSERGSFILPFASLGIGEVICNPWFALYLHQDLRSEKNDV
jgi:hypothetical protein